MTNGTEVGTQQVSATVTDDDPLPTVALGLAGSPLAENGGAATVTATLSTLSGQDVTVSLDFSGTADNLDDYTRSAVFIVIPAGALSRSITLTGVDDLIAEGNETIIVDILSVTNGVEDGTQQVTAMIIDDESGSVVTLAITGSPLAENGGVATVTATLSTLSGQDVTVNLEFSGTASNPGDYTRSATFIVIPAGSTSGSITLTAVQEALDELDETILVDVTTVTNGTEAGTQQVTATITDDDPPPSVSLNLVDSPLAENGGAATVTATLSAISGLDVTVNLGFTGTAESPADYSRSAAFILIPAGSTTGSIMLTGMDDALDEPAETIIVDITSVTNGTESGAQQVTATITDDDPPPSVTLSLDTASIGEAGGTATFTATLSAVSGLPVTVALAFAGTAALTNDYTRSGVQIVVPAGSTTGIVTVTAVQDALDEDNETVVVEITGVVNGTENGTQQETTTITDDDLPPSVTLALSGSPLAENGGVATVTATLSAASSLDVTVTLGFTGSAASPADYATSATLIVIPAGSTTGGVTLTGVNDTVDEIDETIIVDIATVTNGTELGTQQVTATISDDDSPPTVALGLGGSPLAENGGIATVTATLFALSGQDVNVSLEFSGTADNPGDYTRSAVFIVIPAGALSHSITLTGVDDLIAEGNETIIVDILSITNGVEDGTQQVTAIIIDDESGSVVTLAITGSPLAEDSGAATVTATLSMVSSFDVTVVLGFTGSAANPADYTTSAMPIVIPAGSTTGSITLTAVSDGLDEDDETIVVDITSVTNGTEAGTQQVTATITDDDLPPSVTLSVDNANIVEAGGVATFTATLSAVSGLPVTVDLSFTGTAALTSDYTRSGVQIVIPAGSLIGAVTVSALQDTLDEDNETVIVDITGVANGTEGGVQQQTTTITDDDPSPTVTLSLTGSPLAENGGVATVTATLTTASSFDVTIVLGFTGSAANPADYTASATQIFIPAGSTTGSVTLTGVDDALDEAAETIIVDITSVTNGTESGTQQVTATITDDDLPPSVTLALSGSPLAENGGVATVTATLSTVSSFDVTVVLGFTGSAAISADYIASATQIVISAGSSTGSVTLTGVDDTLDEAAETIIVDITSVTNCTESVAQQVTATITDDDPPPSVTLALSGGPLAESGGVATVTATLSTVSSFDVTVVLGFTGSAAISADYIASATQIVISAGSTTGSVMLTGVNDTFEEDNETIVVDITSVTNGAEVVTQQVTATITDDDPPPSVTLAVDIANTAEAAGVATFTATLSAVSGLTVTVDLAFTGTATLTSDYTRSGVQIVVPAGSLTGTVTVTAAQDALDEDSETVVVDITAVTNGTENGTQQQTTTIADDDPPPSVTLALSGSPLAENGGAATVTATLSAASGLDVMVTLGFTGTAAIPADYTTSATSIVIAAGATSGSITLTGADDALDEAAETIIVDIASVTNGTESGTQQVTATISDDDQAPTLTVTGGSVLEGNPGDVRVVFFTLALFAISGKDVAGVVTVSSNGPAELGIDFENITGQAFLIPAGAQEIVVNVPVIEDTNIEGDETFPLIATANDPTTVSNVDGMASGFGTIANDDFAAPTFTINDAQVTEGNAGATTATFTVTLTNNPSGPVSVTVSTADGTGPNSATDADNDYEPLPAGTILTFNAAGSQTVSVAVNGDLKFEQDQTFFVNLSEVTPGTQIGDGQGVGTITNDDSRPTIRINDRSVPETNSSFFDVFFEISLSNPSDETVTVRFDTANGTATTGDSDYVGVTNRTITFNPGVTLILSPVQINGDTKFEANENFFVNLTSATNAASIADSTGQGTIENDDAQPALATIGTNDQIAVNEATVALASAPNNDFNLSGSDLDSDQTLTFSVLVDPAPPLGCTAFDPNNAAHASLLDVGIPLQTPSPGTPPNGQSTASGILRVKAGPNSAGTWCFVVRVSDGVGNSDEQVVVLTVNPTNSPPALAPVDADNLIVLSEATVPLAAAPVFDFPISGTDLDTQQALSFALLVCPSPGPATAYDPNNPAHTGLLGISIPSQTPSPGAPPSGASTAAGTLRIQPGPNAAGGDLSKNWCFVVQVSDAQGGTAAVPVTLTVQRTNSQPQITSDGGGDTVAKSVPENTTFVTDVDATDVDTGQSLTFTIAGGADGAKFSIEQTSGVLSFNSPPDFESPTDAGPNNIYNVVVLVSDGDLIDAQALAVTVTDVNEALPLVTLALSGSPLVENGGVATVTATLSELSNQQVTVNLAFSGTASNPADYTRSASSITILAGSLTGSLTLTSVHDLIDELDETIIVDIDTVTNAVENGTQQVTATITDDDPQPRASLALNPPQALESFFDVFAVVNLDGISDRLTRVRLFTTDGTATTADGDYDAHDQIYTIPANQQQLTITLAGLVNGDSKFEPHETLSFTIEAVENTSLVPGQGSATYTIQNDDAAPTLTVTGGSVLEGNPGDVRVVPFTLSLSAISGTDVAGTVSLASGAAQLGVDFVNLTSLQFTIPAGTQEISIDVPVVEELIYELDETFSLTATVTNPESIAATGNTLSATGTIRNDDLPPSFSIDDVSLDEEDSGTKLFTFTATLIGPTELAASVQVQSQDDTATAGEDYSALPLTTLNFPVGTTSREVSVNVSGDTKFESSEAFLVNLLNPTNATIAAGPAGIGLGTIINDDAQPAIHIAAGAGSTVTEDNSPATFTVSLSNASDQPVSVVVNTANGTASAADSDFTAIVNQTLTFQPGGPLSQTVEVIVNDDNLDEPDTEDFTVALSNPSGGTLGANSAAGVILDNDTVQISISDVGQAESTSGLSTSFNFAVTLSIASSRTIMVEVDTADDTARVADNDYTAIANSVLTFNPGGLLTQTVPVSVIPDNLNEQTETFFVRLSNPTNDAVLNDAEGVGTIQNDDGEPTITITDVTQAEGSGGGLTPFTFTVSLSNPSNQEVRVNFATEDSTAKVSNDDYAANSGTVIFPPNSTASQTITVNVKGDVINEVDEVFSVRLNNPVNAAITKEIGVGTITNDDALPTVTLALTNSPLAENGGVATVTAMLSAVSGQDVTVNLGFSGTASHPGDYTRSAASILIPAGSQSGFITLTGAHDLVDEPNETIIVDITGVTNGLENGTQQVTAEIADDDEARASIALNPLQALESFFDVFVVISLDTISDRPNRVRLFTADGTGPSAATVADSDYDPFDQIYTIPAGQQQLQITLSGLVNGDTKVEPDETFSLNLAAVENTSIAPGQGSAVYTILNDDASGPPPLNPAVVKDDGDSVYRERGLWTSGTGGYLGDVRFVSAGVGAKTATWKLSVTPGTYELFATWTAEANRATNAPYTVFDGAASKGIVPLNQTLAPNDGAYGGKTWEKIGTYDFVSSVIVLQLSDAANGVVLADSVMAVRDLGGGEAPMSPVGAAVDGPDSLGSLPPLVSLDVDDDGEVAPIDALIVINNINSGVRRGIGPSGLGGAASIDVNADDYVSPLDALLIINHLNAYSPGNSVTTAASDAYFSELGEGEAGLGALLSDLVAAETMKTRAKRR